MLKKSSIQKKRRFLAAGILLISTVQYFIAEWITAMAWKVVPYSWSNNDISDLGVPECYRAGENGLDRTICSPLYSVMNSSFLLQSLIVLISFILISRYISLKKRILISFFVSMFVVGLSLVALFPASMSEALGGDAVRSLWHTVGAVLAITGGNLLSISIGVQVFKKHKKYGVFSMFLGTVGLIAGVFLLSGIHFGLGSGGIERVSVNAILVWFVITGINLATHKEV